MMQDGADRKRWSGVPSKANAPGRFQPRPYPREPRPEPPKVSGGLVASALIAGGTSCAWGAVWCLGVLAQTPRGYTGGPPGGIYLPSARIIATMCVLAVYSVVAPMYAIVSGVVIYRRRIASRRGAPATGLLAITLGAVAYGIYAFTIAVGQ